MPKSVKKYQNVQKIPTKILKCAINAKKGKKGLSKNQKCQKCTKMQ
jgi:hypothetical protein